MKFVEVNLLGDYAKMPESSLKDRILKVNTAYIRYVKVNMSLLIEKLDQIPGLVSQCTFGENIIFPIALDIDEVDLYFQVTWTDLNIGQIVAYLFITAENEVICYVDEDA